MKLCLKGSAEKAQQGQTSSSMMTSIEVRLRVVTIIVVVSLLCCCALCAVEGVCTRSYYYLQVLEVLSTRSIIYFSIYS